MMALVDPVVVVPVHEARLDDVAQTAIRHLKHFLGRHRLVLARPSGLDWSIPGLETESFPDDSFGSLLRYNRFQLSPLFYERFASHSHILIYHLDALVLSDDLITWCQTEYDYIGASWYPDQIERYTGNPWPFAPSGCGNGGFSLRRVASFLRHLRERKPVRPLALRRLLEGDMDAAKRIWRFRRHLTPSRYVAHQMLNEDVYWGVFAPLLDPLFRVPSPDVGNLFSFEYNPSMLLRLTKGMLPFGCHAWPRFEDSRAFWEPHLLPPDAAEHGFVNSA